MRTKKILITGEPKSWDKKLPTQYLDQSLQLEWKMLNVLSYEPLEVDTQILNQIEEHPFDWVIFTSPRGVSYFTQALLAKEKLLPSKTGVATIGASTAERARLDGYEPDFIPSKSGSETFLAEFLTLLKSDSNILLPGSLNKRPLIEQTLNQYQHRTTFMPLYQTIPNSQLKEHLSLSDVKASDLILFTSPSSVEALQSVVTLHQEMHVAGMGLFTTAHLKKVGFKHVDILPGGDIKRIGEIL